MRLTQRVTTKTRLLFFVACGKRVAAHFGLHLYIQLIDYRQNPILAVGCNVDVPITCSAYAFISRGEDDSN